MLQPEAWQLAVETDDTFVDVQRFAVGTDRGNAVAAVVPAFPTHLIQTLVPEATTMGVLQGLASGAFTSVTVRRLKVFNTVHVPPLDVWPTFVGHPLVSIEVAVNNDGATSKKTEIKRGDDVLKFQAAVMSLTGRRLRAKLKAEATDRLAKRAKKHATATAALDAMLHHAKDKVNSLRQHVPVQRRSDQGSHSGKIDEMNSL
ncbi:hypothetical protein DYB32_002150 [Aphanomyces invadans]|nr:hypothetical protein DYB32_002150 [Aphanomyces invadans]